MPHLFVCYLRYRVEGLTLTITPFAIQGVALASESAALLQQLECGWKASTATSGGSSAVRAAGVGGGASGENQAIYTCVCVRACVCVCVCMCIYAYR